MTNTHTQFLSHTQSHTQTFLQTWINILVWFIKLEKFGNFSLSYEQLTFRWILILPTWQLYYCFKLWIPPLFSDWLSKYSCGARACYYPIIMRETCYVCLTFAEGGGSCRNAGGKLSVGSFGSQAICDWTVWLSVIVSRLPPLLRSALLSSPAATISALRERGRQREEGF